MIYQYVVTLKNLHKRTIDRFSILACGVSALLFLFQYLTAEEPFLLFLLGGILILLLTGYNSYQLFQKRRARFNYILMMTGLVWAGMPFSPWLSVLLLVMGLVEHQAKKDLEIGFADDVVVVNSIPRKSYEWGEFSNIILRDNLLTMDFNNNKLLQRETVDDDDDDCEEDEFNDYCRQRLSKA